MSSTFQPNRITHYEAAHLAELQGDVSQTVIKYSLELITPPGIPEGSVIHDNAAGSGAVFQTVMEDMPNERKIQIHATDINQNFVQDCKAMAKAKGWPVDTEVMPAQKLGFADNTFTHSFLSFALHCLGDHDAAAREMYRTLKPGGIAVASIWTYMPHVEALQHAHWRTRGRDGPMPVLLPLDGFQEGDLRKALLAGGFKENEVKCFKKDCFLRISDLERWAQLAWSFLGPLPTGWSQSDEDKWDESINDIVEQLKTGDGISQNQKGETVLRMVACIGIAKKEKAQ